jgi:hypothetical protein
MIDRLSKKYKTSTLKAKRVGIPKTYYEPLAKFLKAGVPYPQRDSHVLSEFFTVKVPLL